MRWQRKTARVTNATRGTVVGQRIRVAENGLTRIVGLLGERELQPGDGLLIVPSQGVHTLGMQFPIDIAILDNDWKVIAIRRNLRPFRMTRVFWKAAAALELPSGMLEATSTLVGDRIEFDRVDMAAKSVEK
ncbi:MAG TPA: DUF192 domain-containing protein [Candidatus Limnocylindrales bacterium]|nr:DUF192 domain-containing protein [Candidatus Limnocylindrales bacterium]